MTMKNKTRYSVCLLDETLALCRRENEWASASLRYSVSKLILISLTPL